MGTATSTEKKQQNTGDTWVLDAQETMNNQNGASRHYRWRLFREPAFVWWGTHKEGSEQSVEPSSPASFDRRIQAVDKEVENKQIKEARQALKQSIHAKEVDCAS